MHSFQRYRMIALLAFSVVLMAPGFATTAEIEGVEFSDEIRVAEDSSQRLRIHGLGLLRYRVLFRGYVAALYLPDGLSGSDALMDVPRRLELSYFWSIAGKDFGEAANQLLARKYDAAALARLEPRVERLHRAYRDVRPGDRYALTYVPGVGTELSLNDESLATIPGEDFAEAYFGIWLGDQPLDEDLRDKLLGIQ